MKLLLALINLLGAICLALDVSTVIFRFIGNVVVMLLSPKTTNFTGTSVNFLEITFLLNRLCPTTRRLPIVGGTEVESCIPDSLVVSMRCWFLFQIVDHNPLD